MAVDQLTVAATVLGGVAATYSAIAAYMRHEWRALSVSVSLNQQIDTRFIAGWVHFHDPNHPRRLCVVPLAVDKPELLLDPKPRTVESIWEQLSAAGYRPYSLEVILANKKKRLYRYDNGLKPVFEYK